MKYLSKHIKADGHVETFEREDWAKFTLEELQDYVGGYIEIIYLAGRGGSPNNDPTIMVVNEEGLLDKLKYNEKAAEIALHGIVGDVLVTHKDLIE